MLGTELGSSGKSSGAAYMHNAQCTATSPPLKIKINLGGTDHHAQKELKFCSECVWKSPFRRTGYAWVLSQRLGWAAAVGRHPLAPLSAGASYSHYSLCPAAGKSTPKDSKVESLLRGWEVGWDSRKDPGGLGGERRSHWRPALHLARAPLGQGPRESLISSR